MKVHSSPKLLLAVATNKAVYILDAHALSRGNKQRSNVHPHTTSKLPSPRDLD